MPVFAKELERFGFRTTVVMGEGNPEKKTENVLPGIEVLKDADLVIFFMRFLKLPDKEWAPIEAYLKSGKPVIGLRTANHSFKYAKDHPLFKWNDDFGTKKTFEEAIKKAGFSKIIVKKFVFKYSPGTFSDYWNNYKRHLSKPLKEKFDSLTKFQKSNLREMVQDKTLEYTKKDGKIVFPWEVLVLTARNQ